jgi:transposase
MFPTVRYVGLDVHKRVIEACIVDGRGNVVLRKRFDLTRETLRRFAAEDLLPTDAVALEATTNSWAVVRVLRESVAQVVVSNPLQTKAIAWARLKTDKVDAAMLAQLLRGDLLPLVWQPDEETEALRSITSRRVSLIQDRAALMCRVQSALQQRLIQLPESIRKLFTRKGLAWLRAVLPELPEVARMGIESDLRLHEALGIEIESIDAELYRRAHDDLRLKLLVTLPGVDLVVGQTILAVLGDVSRFPSADKAASYFGLVPRTRQSASKTTYGRISKSGSSHARSLMIQAAWASTAAPGPLAGFYKKLRKKKNHGIAVVAVARKLVTYAWHILKNEEPYRYASPGTTATKLSRIRLRGGGERRPSLKSEPPARETWKAGHRVTPSIHRVYEVEGLPPHGGFDALGSRRCCARRGWSGKRERSRRPSGSTPVGRSLIRSRRRRGAQCRRHATLDYCS